MRKRHHVYNTHAIPLSHWICRFHEVEALSFLLFSSTVWIFKHIDNKLAPVLLTKYICRFCYGCSCRLIRPLWFTGCMKCNLKCIKFFCLILCNSDHSSDAATQQKGGIEPTMHTNEENFSRVCCWNLIKHSERLICAWHTEIQENGIMWVNYI